MPAIRRPLAEITSADLQCLIDEGWAEDDQLEFKETLASEGPTQDRWLVDQNGVSDFAKRKVLREVVGMANSYGGDVVLGIREGDAEPHRAEALTPIPKCHDLARRFEMFARDHISPQIPMLMIQGIPIEKEAGAVVFRVPASTLAPHRLEVGKSVRECYKRTRSRTEAMSMREIQDLTLDRARGMAHVEQRIRALREEYIAFCDHKRLAETDQHAYSYSAIAVPLSPGLNLRKVHGVPEVTPLVGASFVEFSDGGRYECLDSSHSTAWKPMLRGTRLADMHSDSRHMIQLTTDGNYLACTCEITKGRAELEKAFALGWMLNMIINACESVDRVRRFAGADSVEYALQVEVDSIAHPHRVMRLGMQRLAEPALGTLTGTLLLPQYSLGPPSDRAQLMTLVVEDVLSVLEREAKADQIVKVGR